MATTATNSQSRPLNFIHENAYAAIAPMPTDKITAGMVIFTELKKNWREVGAARRRREHGVVVGERELGFDEGLPPPRRLDLCLWPHRGDEQAERGDRPQEHEGDTRSSARRGSTARRSPTARSARRPSPRRGRVVRQRPGPDVVASTGSVTTSARHLDRLCSSRSSARRWARRLMTTTGITKRNNSTAYADPKPARPWTKKIRRTRWRSCSCRSCRRSSRPRCRTP